jgi:CAAX protease family protein
MEAHTQQAAAHWVRSAWRLERDVGGQPERHREPWPAWPWWYSIVGVLAGAAVAIGVGLLAFAVLDLPWGDLWGEALWIGAFVVVAVLLARRRGRGTLRDLGVQAAPARAAVGWVILGLTAVFASEAVWQWLAQSSYTNVTSPVGTSDPSGVIGIVISTVVLAPIGEELFFRGFLYGALRSRLGVLPAALIASSVFGAAHAFPGGDSWVIVPSLAFAGLVLCLLYEQTHSLLPGIALHVFMNALAIGVITSHAGAVWGAGVAVAAVFLLAPWRWLSGVGLRRLPDPV